MSAPASAGQRLSSTGTLACATKTTGSFREKAQSACRVKGEHTSLRRRDAFQFQKGEAGFLEFRYFCAGVQDVADHEVQVRFVAETKYDFGFHRLQLPQ